MLQGVSNGFVVVVMSYEDECRVEIQTGLLEFLQDLSHEYRSVHEHQHKM